MPQGCYSGGGGWGARGRGSSCCGSKPPSSQDVNDQCYPVTTDVNKKLKSKSLFICNYCNKDTRKTGGVEKVIVGGRANILCTSCKTLLENSIRDITKRFLG